MNTYLSGFWLAEVSVQVALVFFQSEKIWKDIKQIITCIALGAKLLVLF